MNRSKLLFLLILFFFINFSCKKENKEELIENRKSVIIAGEFYNITSIDSLSNVGIYVQDYITKDITSTEKKVDSTGKFIFEFNITKQQGVMLLHNTVIDLIVNPSDSLYIKIDAQSFNRKEILGNLQISGTSAEINNDVKSFFYNDPIDSNIFQENRRSLKPNAFKKYRDSAYLSQSKYADSLLTYGSFSQPFMNWLEAQKLFALPASYSFYEFYFEKEDQNGQNLELNKNDLSNANKYNLDNLPLILPKHQINTLASNRIPKRLLDYTVISSKQESSALNPDDEYSFYLERMIETYSNKPKLLQSMVNEFAKSTLNIEYLDFYENNKTVIDSLLSQTDFEVSLKEKYIAVKKRIKNPELYNKINIKEYYSSNVDSLLQNIISDAKGKPIYIDNWATWCQPCLSEFKENTPELITQFKDRVEFVFFCYKSNEEHWKSTISKYQLEGKHYFISNNQTEDLTNLLSINGFPTYTIINKKGEIINSGNSYSPSNSKTREILMELLEK